MKIPPHAFHCDDCRTWQDAYDEACRLSKGRVWHIYIRSHRHRDHYGWQIWVA